MTKEEIKKLLDGSKKQLDQNYEHFEKAVKDELNSFKKKTLEQID